MKLKPAPLAKLHSSTSLVCVGLDSDTRQLPEQFLSVADPQFAFNQWIIDQTHQYVAAYKLNTAFYEAHGELGWKQLALTMRYLTQRYPHIMTIADAKRGDIGTTNEGYVAALFDELNFDAVTLHPFLGKESLAPFLRRKDKVCIVLCRTSNPGSGEFQDLKVGTNPLWKIIAKNVKNNWNENNNCMLVVGATYPEEMATIRATVGEEMILLVPGIGAQGGDLQAVLRAGLTTRKRGVLISASRSIIFAPDPGAAARDLHLEITDFCQKA